jgi:hypothetical protein
LEEQAMVSAFVGAVLGAVAVLLGIAVGELAHRWAGPDVK